MNLTFISLFSFLLLISTRGIGQVDLCQNIYVWDFKTVKNERNSISRTLSNEVENVLSQINDCKVLQRRKYADIKQQVDIEIEISKREDLSDDLRKKLKTIQAERVLFGEIELDFSFNLKLRLSLENLNTKQIKASTIIMKGEEMINQSLRVEIIQDGIFKFLKLNALEESISNNRSKDDPFVNKKIKGYTSIGFMGTGGLGTAFGLGSIACARLEWNNAKPKTNGLRKSLNKKIKNGLIIASISTAVFGTGYYLHKKRKRDNKKKKMNVQFIPKVSRLPLNEEVIEIGLKIGF